MTNKIDYEKMYNELKDSLVRINGYDSFNAVDFQYYGKDQIINYSKENIAMNIAKYLLSNDLIKFVQDEEDKRVRLYGSIEVRKKSDK